MWIPQWSSEFARRHKEYEKKHPRELMAMMDNLDTVHKALMAGTKPLQMSFGFLHKEPKGVWGIDQKGGGPNLKQTRLYSFAHEETELLHLITIGDKRNQGKEIQFCKEYVDALRQQTTKKTELIAHEEEQAAPESK